MAKVIQTVLSLKDNMSGGLLNVAKNTQGVTQDMRDATRNVLTFKNKAGTAIKTFATDTAKAFGNTVAKSAKLLTGTVVGLSGSFMALDPLTEEFRTAQGKVNTAFQSVGSNVQTASAAYRELYGVIGDHGATAEAAQHLSSLTTSQQGLVQWTNAAIGVYGKFGDAVPLETLFEAASETSRTGVLTGTLVDAIIRGTKEGERFGVALRADTEANKEWNEAVKAAQTSEDFFNLALQECSSEAERQSLILNFLTNAYGDSANAFKENNSQLIQSNKNQLALSSVMAKLGDSASKVKNTLAGALGVKSDGAIRTGSVFDIINQNAEKLSATISGFVANGGAEKLGQMLDKGLVQASQMASSAIKYLKDNGKEMFNIFKTGVSTMATSMAKFVQDGSAEKLANMIKNGITKAFELATSAVKYFSENGDTLIAKLKGLAVAVGTIKILQFGYNAFSTAKTLWNFGKTILTIAKAHIPLLTAAYWKNTAAAIANKALLNGIWLKNQIVHITTASAAWIHNTAMLGLNKAGLLAHKVVGGAIWLGTQAKAIAISSAAWVKNTAALAANKIGLIASKVATGAMAVGTAALTAAQWALNTAFYATPIGWIVAGITGLIAVGVALYKNWDTVKAKATELWGKTVEVFGGIKDSIVGAFGAAKEKIGGFFAWIDEKIQSIPLLGDLYSGAKGAVEWIAQSVGFNAMGTNYWRGGLTYVNERGGELINLPSGTQIIPHDISLNIAKDYSANLANLNSRTVSSDSIKKIGTAGTRNVTINAPVTINGNISDRRYVDVLSEQIAGKILRKMENMA